MTPAITAGIPFVVHEYKHTASAQAYGREAAAALGVDPGRVFKTLVVSLGNERLAVANVPVRKKLDLKAIAVALGAKKAAMADSTDAERATGYVLGGISPLGQRKRLPVVIDRSVLAHESVYVSAGKRGLEIELAPRNLIQLVSAKIAPVSC
ncbi:MAG: Cys-tRNA(Pro) deacylase [Acidiferrobacterales bacterium]